MFLRCIEISIIITIISSNVLLGIICKGVNGEIIPVIEMIDNPVMGKKYWLYEKLGNFSTARETCEKNGQELVQLPTKSEQLWVYKNLAHFKDYWVGAFEFGNRMFWKVPNGKILIDINRYFIQSIRHNQVTSAHEDHLHWYDANMRKSIICQKDYSEKKGNFEMLTGKHQFRQKVNEFVGGKFRCASKCMMLVECKVFLLDFLKGHCRLYSGLVDSNPQENAIDCDSSSISCFARF